MDSESTLNQLLVEMDGFAAGQLIGPAAENTKVSDWVSDLHALIASYPCLHASSSTLLA